MVNQILHSTKRDMDPAGLVAGLTRTEMPLPLPLPLQMPLAGKQSEESAHVETTFQRAGFPPQPQSISSPVSEDEIEDELSDDDDDDWENDSLLLDSLEQLGEDHFYGAGTLNFEVFLLRHVIN